MHNPHGIKLLTRLRVGLSYLLEHKFRYNFQDSLDPFCSFSTAQINQIKEKHFLIKLVTSNVLY